MDVSVPRRCVQVAFAVFFCFTCAGIIFGFAGSCFVMPSMNSYLLSVVCVQLSNQYWYLRVCMQISVVKENLGPIKAHHARTR